MERIVRLEEELKYLREDIKQLREDIKQLCEDMERCFAKQRKDTKQLCEDMNRHVTIVLWVVSGWGFLTGLLVTAAPYVFK